MVDILSVVPMRDMVIVRLLNLEDTYEDLITVNKSDELEIAVRYGEVLAMGPDVDSPKHCQDLKLQEKVFFTEFAGYYIATEDTEYIYKAIRGHDIIGKHMKEDDILDVDSAIPTGDRVLVEVIDFTREADGLIIQSSDPKLMDLMYGKVVKLNETTSNLNLTLGQEVAFAPYVGVSIRNYESEDKKELRIIIEDDILFTI